MLPRHARRSWRFAEAPATPRRGLAHARKLLDTRRDAFGDALVVLRNDRYCLPVQASSRGRVPGIVHDRSGSGQTVFVEPLEVIEANNDLALLAAEERREVERLLREFGLLVLSQEPELRAASRELAALDALEAKVAFAEIGEARLPEIADDGTWTLRAARHPLLDRRFEPLRRRVPESARDGRDAVPLDSNFPPTAGSWSSRAPTPAVRRSF
jgi:DNA mismatch repair protein MutS2